MSTQGSTRSLAPAPGVTPPPTDGSSYRFLSDVIIARGLVEPSAMKAALQASLAGRSLTEILVDNGDLGEDDLARTLAEHHRLDHVDLEIFAVDHDAASLIEPDVAHRFGAVPIATLPSGAIVVALHDPNGSTAALEFARLTGRMIQPAVASRTQIETLIESLRHERASVENMALVGSGAPAGDVAFGLPGGERVGTGAGPAGAAPAPAGPAQRSAAADAGHLAAVRHRAEDAERRCHETEERARAAEERARAAEELTRLADARARASEERAQAAGELVVAAEVRGGEPSSAAGAANDLLMRLLHACETLEREAESRGPEAGVLRTLLDAERAQRMQLEAQLRHPPELLHALQARVAQLERRVAAPEGADAAPPTQLSPAEPKVAAAAPPKQLSPTEPEVAAAAPPTQLSPAEPKVAAAAPPKQLSPTEPEVAAAAPPTQLSPAEPEVAEAAPPTQLSPPGLALEPVPEPEVQEPSPEPRPTEPAPEEASAHLDEPFAEPPAEPTDAGLVAEEDPSWPTPVLPQSRVKTRERRGLFGARKRG
jgi:hypothetical protein